ncbi:RNA polymerase sigma factor [Thermogutta sp.]|jgi:RNA polymerase sigma-70 factor (ECF subfamily)|uniref:RNA polymerase sigma factor n=1 Tax=Thermogutta sp. TaxID=1962930 RepID=UPI003C7C3E4F
MSNDERADLLDRFRRGDPTALAELYDRFAGRLYRVAFRMLGDHGLAKDAVQEVFLGVLKVRYRLGTLEDLSAYLFCCLRRAVGRLQVIRQRNKNLAHGSFQDAETGAPETQGGETIWSKWVLQALQQLPPEQQEVVLLKIEGELTFAEIAMALGISPNTAASRYRYALQKLRHYLSAQKE